MGADSLKKIEHLERQAKRYEQEIFYLESTIEKLDIQHSDDIFEKETLLSHNSKLSQLLRKSESLCDQRELFIQYRESQLLELEGEVYNLKQRIATLSSKKSLKNMEDKTHTDNPLDGLSNDELVQKMNNIINKMFSMLKQNLKTTGNVDRIISLREEGLYAIQRLFILDTRMNYMTVKHHDKL